MKKWLICAAMITMILPLRSQNLQTGGIISEPVTQGTPQNPPKAVKEPFVREADVMWAKRIWRVVDMRQKMNQIYYYPMQPSNDRVNLMYLIMQGIREGSITPYDAANGDDFQSKMDPEKALMIGTHTDTVMIADAFPPYNERPVAITTEFDPSVVIKFKIKEDWYFDRQRSVMKVRILGICPVMQVYDQSSGELKGEMDMYWVYYPQARDYFSMYKLYNRYNMAHRLSYDDALQIRLFSSTIIKQDNTQDAFIGEYLKGEEALWEGEDIKNRIMLYESDLWEY